MRIRNHSDLVVLHTEHNTAQAFFFNTTLAISCIRLVLFHILFD